MLEDGGRSPLRQRHDVPKPVSVPQFSKTSIVWSGNGVTKIPDQWVDDPFVRGLVKYFNSRYFNSEVGSKSYVAKYKSAIQLFFEILDIRGLSSVPENIYAIILGHMKEMDFTEAKIERWYQCIRTPARKLSTVAVKNKNRSNIKLLREISIDSDERSILIRANRLAPNVRNVQNNPFPDLIEALNIEDEEWAQGDLIISSIRAFCAFFISEWSQLREKFLDQFPNEVSSFIERYKSNNKWPGKKIRYGHYFLGGTKYHNYCVDHVLEIVKSIDHPFLTELFAYQYLDIGSRYNKSISDFLKDAWNPETMVSTACEVDWLDRISKIYRNSTTGRLMPIQQAHTDQAKRGKGKNYPDLNPRWSTRLTACIEGQALIGLSRSEQVCMAWLLATDRHQPSNLRWMTLGDVAFTDNGVSTFIDPHTLKGRANRSSGAQYQFSVNGNQEVFNRDAGAAYKRGQNIHSAFLDYRRQLIRASRNGLLHEVEPSGELDDVWFLSEVRAPSSKTGKGGYIETRYLSIHPSAISTMEIFLAAMDGSITNRYVLDKCPEAELFFKVLRKCARDSDFDEPIERQKSVGIGLINRLEVNNKLGRLYSLEELPLSKDNSMAISDRSKMVEAARDAATHNHAVGTALNVYADKLPRYMADSANFGARVGDEAVRMAAQLGEVKAGKTSVMSMSELRKQLGVETVREKEIEQLNELLEQVDLEGYVVDELGLIQDAESKVVVIRHPITIRLIQSEINSIDEQVCNLQYSNEDRLNRLMIRYMYLKMLLVEKFTPSEIRESEYLYGDVVFPMSDILV